MQNPMNRLDGRERVGIATAVGILLLLGLGIWSYRQTDAAPLAPTPSAQMSPEADVAVVLPARDIATGQTLASPAPVAAPSPVVVHVVGAVRHPGIYTCRPGERIYQAIYRAGGFRANARREAINLADWVQDADQIVVPAIGAPDPQAGANVAPPTPRPGAHPPGRVVGRAAPTGQGTKGRAASGSAKFKSPGDGVVHLNTATSEQLQRLPGVGPAMAERILAHRKEIGKFTDVMELRNVSGIGEKKLAKMQPFLRVD